MGDSIGIKRRDLVCAGGALLAASAFSGEAAVNAIGSPANAQAGAATPTALPSDQSVKSPQTPTFTPIR